jgi:hypothetical protein
VLPAALRGPDLAIHDPQSLFETSVEIWSRASSQLFALSEARGIAYHHFLQPNQYVTGSKVLTDAERETAILAADSSTRFGAETGYPLLIAEGRRLRAAGVPFHDLTNLFAEVEEPIYRDGCCHYLLAGYELVARQIARTISAAAD